MGLVQSRNQVGPIADYRGGQFALTFPKDKYRRFTLLFNQATDEFIINVKGENRASYSIGKRGVKFKLYIDVMRDDYHSLEGLRVVKICPFDTMTIVLHANKTITLLESCGQPLDLEKEVPELALDDVLSKMSQSKS